MCWKNNIVQVKDIKASKQSIHCEICLLNSDPNCFSSIVYGSNEPIERRNLLQDIESMTVK